MHPSVSRQLHKLGISEDRVPDLKDWVSFVQQVSTVYQSHDEDRYLVERALEVSSREMRELLAELEQRNELLRKKTLEDQEKARRLRHAATHDQLTGLPNRVILLERLAACIARASRSKSYHYALLFIDLDDFKVINDSLGHETGDQVLMGLAERLGSVCGELEHGTPLCCRLGGDEFVILLDHIDGLEAAKAVAGKLRRHLDEPFLLENNRFVLSASVGLLLGDSRYVSPSDLLRDADTAMYHAKTHGKGRHSVFDTRMHKEMSNRLEIEQGLWGALQRDEFFMVHQPIVDLATGRVRGMESLLRWEHPERGVVPPPQFIEIAENTGLIRPIGDRVIQMACADLTRMRRTEGFGDLTITINVSRRQINDKLLPTLRAACAEHGLDPGCVIVEVTESAAIGGSVAGDEVLMGIRNAGHPIYMDDFGTGLSSLSMLHELPFDAIKIDRSFIQRMTEQREHAAIAMSIILLAHNLGLKVVAEGLETREQVMMLQSCDCDCGQGYLIARPMRCDSAIRWLTSKDADFSGLLMAA
ncbi:MAG: EAL domain-containing protein [Phycisphaeraceae bacterium]|nr:EAL domain-containing protein [Phycisphaeraceae bacterium]MCB9848309.1 EAL domain-containing protein [Phycisphaeraceae bacterium]